MDISATPHEGSRFKVRKTAMAIALACTICSTATHPARADNGQHRGWHHGPRWHHDERPWRGPDVYYAPAPNYYYAPRHYYYAPPPVVYYPRPPSGVELFFGLR